MGIMMEGGSRWWQRLDIIMRYNEGADAIKTQTELSTSYSTITPPPPPQVSSGNAPRLRFLLCKMVMVLTLQGYYEN